jgi:pimeloyl-ACP methyl ester carboxylesterase
VADGDASPDVAVHVLADHGGTPVLVSHATGFHGRCYRKLAESLGEGFHVVAFDHRGHGDTPIPPGWSGYDWRGYGTDTLAIARRLAEGSGQPLIGFGHSMGGATLLMAAHADPHVFARLVLFEPVAAPSDREVGDPEEWPIVSGARRRRARFESLQAAFDNYASKPPLALLDRDVLWDYVRYGFRWLPAGGDGPAGYELACAPDHEAATFVGGITNGVWQQLPDIGVPVTVVGSEDGGSPAEMAGPVAERLAHGTYVAVPGWTHFGPLSHPAETAALVAG